MELNPFALIITGFDENHPADYDLCIDHLPRALYDQVRSLTYSFKLGHFQDRSLATYVPFTDVYLNLGCRPAFNSPDSDYYIPPKARIQLPYTNTPISGPTSSVRAGQMLASAHARAKRLLTYRAGLPPAPFNMLIRCEEVEFDMSIARLVTEALVETYRTREGWWVIEHEARAHLPDGESFDDEHSEWCRDRHAWADQDELDQIIDAHCKTWPEVYQTVLEVRPGPGPQPAHRQKLALPYVPLGDRDPASTPRVEI
ncbi:hypothetical protein [Sphingomonas crocodyli]|uniref:Uncharacterized protein n=1 Tax=Sphingomonas crocodyli TaxID=1979270 RepID=A0A437M7B3_9SPHN|nr:hypothetical protein [Sphingomonas crocodyli]RVT93436.1 hypothetical protein EOD43_06045 [Sphingomonas crocodyli]